MLIPNMSEGLHLPDGHHVVPEVGPRLALASIRKALCLFKTGSYLHQKRTLGIRSLLRRYFQTPRAAAFADVLLGAATPFRCAAALFAGTI